MGAEVEPLVDDCSRPGSTRSMSPRSYFSTPTTRDTEAAKASPPLCTTTEDFEASDAGGSASRTQGKAPATAGVNDDADQTFVCNRPSPSPGSRSASQTRQSFVPGTPRQNRKF